MTQVERIKIQQAAVSAYREQLREKLSKATDELRQQLTRGRLELDRADNNLRVKEAELQAYQVQLNALKGARSSLAALVSKFAAQVDALEQTIRVVSQQV